MMMIVENIPWNIFVWNVVIDEYSQQSLTLSERFIYFYYGIDAKQNL